MSFVERVCAALEQGKWQSMAHPQAQAYNAIIARDIAKIRRIAAEGATSEEVEAVANAIDSQDDSAKDYSVEEFHKRAARAAISALIGGKEE